MEEWATFEMTENKITQNTADPIVYDIEGLTDSTLELSTALRGLDFKLVFKMTQE